MTFTYSFCALLVFTLTACSRFGPTFCAPKCGGSLQVLDSKEGEISSSTYRSWSFHYGSLYDCWVIKGSEEEPIVLSFSQFETRCRKEWVSIKSSAGGEAIVLCGSKLPQPMEFPGGNITVMHHFLPQRYPVSSFRLSYARDYDECPVSSFECPGGGRCIPFSWRCNGQVECLGEGAGQGDDEQGCEADEETLEPTKHGLTQTEETHTESNRDSDKPFLVDNESDLWELLKEREEEEARVDRVVAHTHRQPAVTPTPIEWPCGGLLQTFYGTFSPPALRGPPLLCVWTLDPQDSRPLRLDLQQLVLGRGDRLSIYNREKGKGDIIKIITSASNYKSVQVESHTGLLSMTYETLPESEGNGFNATFHVGTYCPPWEGQRSVASSRLAGIPVCYPVTERCNYQLYCVDGGDERDCTVCQPGTFHCDSDRCVFESWRCDGQVDCKDGTDELNCTVILPRKVITAATVGSLVCGLLLVIAMGCTCKLYSLRTREYSLFAPISRQEAELIQQQAPPSYGQLIAQGIIPPVEDFPTENPNEASSLSLRGILQLLRQDAASSPHRRRRPRFIRRAVRRMRRKRLSPPPQLLVGRGGGQPAGAAETGINGSVGAAYARSIASSSDDAFSAPSIAPPTSVRPPGSHPPRPPGLRPPQQPLSCLHLPHTGTQHLPLQSPPPSSANSMPLSASPSFSSSSSSSDDEVLLIPLMEDATSEDDVPMLT
ncbi:hypothetical protein CgunFtcFv8_006315 [Champsocephalus gunnari]|uniref:CUB domain-containing protein n=1 Tax=Champsocephalus gunnari TaxID=52237 RepID=A0AAN8C1K3_CHAGU|nr:hypothetical protein CgunFtcFv8_006315 [Champsocephalus gunnari]